MCAAFRLNGTLGRTGAMMEKELEPYWPPRRMHKKPSGKQLLAYKGFCALCGIYSRRNLTRADYIDPVQQSHATGVLCANCFSEITEAQDDRVAGDE